MDEARPCSVVEITTPKGVVLNGLWFGDAKARTVIIWVHGLGSSVFSKLKIVSMLARGGIAVLVFNNRGHDVVSRISHISRLSKKAREGGAAHEIFTDCVDDIDGALSFAKQHGAKEIYLAGHSTGCQKSIYWASKRRTGVKGIILLAPISDRSAEVHLKGKQKVEKALKIARALVRSGKNHTILPAAVWPQTFDAQRFVSLCSPESKEEIFTYWDQKKHPRTLRSVKLPILVLLAENDEYADRPAKTMAEWFEKQVKISDGVEVIPSVEHSFRGGEVQVVAHIRRHVGTRS